MKRLLASGLLMVTAASACARSEYEIRWVPEGDLVREGAVSGLAAAPFMAGNSGPAIPALRIGWVPSADAEVYEVLLVDEDNAPSTVRRSQVVPSGACDIPLPRPGDSRLSCQLNLVADADGAPLLPATSYIISILADEDPTLESVKIRVRTLDPENPPSSRLFIQPAVDSGTPAASYVGWSLDSIDLPTGSDDLLVGAPGDTTSLPLALQSPDCGTPTDTPGEAFIARSSNDANPDWPPLIDMAPAQRFTLNGAGDALFGLSVHSARASDGGPEVYAGVGNTTGPGSVAIFVPGTENPDTTADAMPNGKDDNFLPHSFASLRIDTDGDEQPDSDWVLPGSPLGGNGTVLQITYESPSFNMKDYVAGTSAGTGFGKSVAVAYEETLPTPGSSPTVFVGAPAAVTDGRVFVYGGAASGDLNPSTTATLAPPGSGAVGTNFGYALATGDFNGDGLTDVAVGAPGMSGDGRVIMFPGPLDESLSVVFSPRVTQENGPTAMVDFTTGRFGHALAMGDVNGDGLDDLVVGAPSARAIETDQDAAGGFAVFLGRASVQGTADPVSNPIEPDYVWTSAVSQPIQLGHSITIGDFDDDGTKDIALGAPCYSRSQGMGIVEATGSVAFQHGVPNAGPAVVPGINVIAEVGDDTELPPYFEWAQDWMEFAPGAFECSIDWGDGQVDAPAGLCGDILVEAPVHAYEEPGAYAVRMRVAMTGFSKGEYAYGFSSVAASTICVGPEFRSICEGQNGL